MSFAKLLETPLLQNGLGQLLMISAVIFFYFCDCLLESAEETDGTCSIEPFF